MIFWKVKFQFTMNVALSPNGMGINEGGMVNGAMSRKVEITLNSAVSLVQTLQPLLFIPCYKSGGGSSKHLDREVASLSERCLLEELLTSPPLAYNYLTAAN